MSDRRICLLQARRFMRKKCSLRKMIRKGIHAIYTNPKIFHYSCACYSAWWIVSGCILRNNFSHSCFQLVSSVLVLASMAEAPGRGGIRQRLDHAEALAQAPSALAKFLLQEFAWGRMSATEVQRIAGHAKQDMDQVRAGRTLNDLDQLAAIGTEGYNPGNCYRDVMKIINKHSDLPPATQVDMPTKRGNGTCSLMLPHVVFSYLYHRNREQFEKLFCPGGTDQLKKFWSQCQHTPGFKDQSARSTLKPDRCVPVGCHGDEVPVAGRGKTYCKFSVVFSWFSLWASMLPTRESLLLIWCSNPAQFVEGVEGTLHTYWSALSWSLKALAAGRWPTRDWRGIRFDPQSAEGQKGGSLLAGGFYGILISLCGDLDYNNKFLSLPHWSSSTRPCNLCLCTATGSHTWRDFRLEAPWRSTLFTSLGWMADPGRSRCILFDNPNISGLTAQPDWMHIKFLGFQQFFLGSCLFLLCHQLLPSSPLQNLRRIGLMVFRLQRRRPGTTRIPLNYWSKLSVFMKKKGFPKMKGSAAQIKAAVPLIRAVWLKFASHENLNHRRISLVFKLDREIEDILVEFSPQHGYYALPLEQARNIREKQAALSQLMVMLEEFYSNEPRPLFNVVSKLHYAAHAVDSANTLHPFLNWCWKGEDFMSVTSTLISACLRSRNDIGATVAAMDRYRYAMYRQWS